MDRNIPQSKYEHLSANRSRNGPKIYGSSRPGIRPRPNMSRINHLLFDAHEREFYFMIRKKYNLPPYNSSTCPSILKIHDSTRQDTSKIQPGRSSAAFSGLAPSSTFRQLSRPDCLSSSVQADNSHSRAGVVTNRPTTYLLPKISAKAHLLDDFHSKAAALMNRSPSNSLHKSSLFNNSLPKSSVDPPSSDEFYKKASALLCEPTKPSFSHIDGTLDQRSGIQNLHPLTESRKELQGSQNGKSASPTSPITINSASSPEPEDSDLGDFEPRPEESTSDAIPNQEISDSSDIRAPDSSSQDFQATASQPEPTRPNLKRANSLSAEEQHDRQQATTVKSRELSDLQNVELLERFRREGLPDELCLKSDGTTINWPKLALPDDLWKNAINLTEEMFQHRTIRQTQRRRLVIFCAVIIILARQASIPRTFSEVCILSETTKKEVGATYKLVQTVQKGEDGAVVAPTPHIDVAQLIHRWCKSLGLPNPVAQAAVDLNDFARQQGITHTRCPTSACAASIWFIVNSLAIHREKLHREKLRRDESLADLPLALKCTQQDVLREGQVVLATLNGVMKLMAPHAATLFPQEKLLELEGLLRPTLPSPQHQSAPVPSPLPNSSPSPEEPTSPRKPSPEKMSD